MWKTRSVENEESENEESENEECEKIRSVEYGEYRKCGVLKIQSVENV